MPRKSRIDAAGAIHQFTVRGIERDAVFRNDADRNHFLERLGRILQDTKTIRYAWALIPNHFHLLLRTGPVPISTVMRRLLTGVAGSALDIGQNKERKPLPNQTIQRASHSRR
jgi:putative transposase